MPDLKDATIYLNKEACLYSLGITKRDCNYRSCIDLYMIGTIIMPKITTKVEIQLKTDPKI